VPDAGTGLPLSGATVSLSATGYAQSALTNLGYVRQTDWSGGYGQSYFSDEKYVFDFARKPLLDECKSASGKRKKEQRQQFETINAEPCDQKTRPWETRNIRTSHNSCHPGDRREADSGLGKADGDRKAHNGYCSAVPGDSVKKTSIFQYCLRLNQSGELSAKIWNADWSPVWRSLCLLPRGCFFYTKCAARNRISWAIKGALPSAPILSLILL
jgi:hypothetical protein